MTQIHDSYSAAELSDLSDYLASDSGKRIVTAYLATQALTESMHTDVQAIVDLNTLIFD